MDGFDYLRRSNTMLLPRTPTAAYRAVEEGFLPEAAFVYSSCGARSLLERPFRIEDLERILSIEHLDYETILLLMRIFTELLGHPDMDTALFAAEGMNTIEGRYNEKVELYRALIEMDPDPEYRRLLASALWEIAGINEKKRSIRNFYLREAFSQLRHSAEKSPMTRSDGILMVKILLRLELYGQAREILHRLDPDRADPRLLLLEAETAYRERDFLRVAEILHSLESKDLEEFPEAKGLIDVWLNERNGEAAGNAGLRDS